jgi:hypothetical protein
MFSALFSQTVPVTALRPQQSEQMFQLMQVCYDGIDPHRFSADLQKKQYVIMLFVRASGALVGFSTIQVKDEVLQGRAVEVCFSGDTIIHPNYWGDKTLQIAFGRFVLWRKLRRPYRPCLWLLLTKGYKTYLLLVNNFPCSFPRRGVTPSPGYQDFLHRIAQARWPHEYDASRGVLDFRGCRDRVKPDCTPIDAQARMNPDVAFFVRRNPAHGEGTELVCLAEMRFRDLLYGIFRATGTQVRRVCHRLRTMRAPRKYAGARP